MLKICGARHQIIWYEGEKDNKLDCPLCHTIELLEKAKVLPIAFENVFLKLPKDLPLIINEGSKSKKKVGRPWRKK